MTFCAILCLADVSIIDTLWNGGTNSPIFALIWGTAI